MPSVVCQNMLTQKNSKSVFVKVCEIIFSCVVFFCEKAREYLHINNNNKMIFP